MIEKILHLTLMKEWFDQILDGTKKVEYREIKPYWTKRLIDKDGEPIEYDAILFRNGYSRAARKMKVEFEGLRTRKEYEILLGKVLWTSMRG